MNRIVIVLLSFATAVTSVLVVSTATSPTLGEQPSAPTKDSGAEIKALQKERVEALTTLVNELVTQFDLGRVEFRSLAVAANELANAKLDLTEKPDERIALLDEQLTRAKKILDIADARFRAASGTRADVYWAKSFYLEMKIKLVRERAKQKVE